MDEENFGALLRRWRQQRELTQEDLGKKAGVSESYISKLERGDRPPAEKIVNALAGCLKLEGADRVKFVKAARLARDVHQADRASEETRPSPKLKRLPPLPRLDSPVVGREAEIQRIKPLLERQGQIVNIVGDPGIGKTTVAKKLAHQFFERGRVVLWGDAREREASSREDIELFLWDALVGRQAPRTEIEKLKRIRGALARHRVLLFLDNLESAQDFDDILTYLSQIAPPATVLLTSRRYIPGRLGHNIPLYELGVEEGIALFEQIGARYERRLGSAEEKTMVEIICGDLLQGHPGAIEIAAALWRSWPLREILRGLHTRAMETLVDRERTDVNRSMRLSIGLSYDLLARENPGAWTLFPRLSVFSASFTAQATEQVCEVPNSLPSLDFLVNRSLVRFDRRRYHLHAVVREYGLEKLGEDRAYFERSAAFYFLDYALQYSEDLDALEEERGNLFATIEWYEHKEPTLVPQLVGLLHTFMDRRGYWEERLRRTRKALQIAELLGDAEEMAHLCFVMGSTHRNRGEFEEARAYFERGLAIGLRIADDRAAGTGYHLLATMAYDQDDLDEARTFALEAVRVFDRAQLKDLLAFVYSLLVSIERRSGDLEEAYRYAEKELGLARDMGDPDQRDIALQDLVEIALDARDYARAERHIEKSTGRWLRKRKHRRSRGVSLCFWPRWLLSRRIGLKREHTSWLLYRYLSATAARRRSW